MSDYTQILIVSLLFGIGMLALSMFLGNQAGKSTSGNGYLVGEKNTRTVGCIGIISIIIFFVLLFKVIAGWLPEKVWQYGIIIIGVGMVLYIGYRIAKSLFEIIRKESNEGNYTGIGCGFLYVGLILFYIFIAVVVIRKVWFFLTSIFD